MPTLYLVDASVFIFRAYFSLGEHIRDRSGAPAAAVFGFGQFLCELIEKRGPSHLAVAFDESLGSSFRNTLYPAYKANRPEAPADLQRQFHACRALTAALGIAGFASASHEADDLIGSLGVRARSEGADLMLVSADKDLCQLIRGRDRLWDPTRGRSLDAAGVYASFGVWPEQMADLLGLAGDAVDNIPGVPGIGPKTAAALLQNFETLEGVYADLRQVATLPLRGASRVQRLLEAHREEAWLSRTLATIDCGAPLSVELDDLVWRGADPDAVAALGLPGALARRALRLSCRELRQEA